MRTICVVHFNPISYYPPAMNMVDSLKHNLKVDIITTRAERGLLEYKSGGVSQYVPICNRKKDHSLFRLLKYVWFTLTSVIRMIKKCPDVILYYESYSALPVYLYKRYFNHKVRVFVHYHEYSTPEEYLASGQRINAFNHKKEQQWLYERAEWVSQTNLKRLQMFLADNISVNAEIAHVLPNYPPKSWLRKEKKHTSDVCKCVYIGSLSLTDMFLKEFCEWIKYQEGMVTFDIYGFNFHSDVVSFIKHLDCPWIHFHNQGVKYNEIPQVLDKYDVGLLLYKAHSVNFKWNETNKLYEYLICGLDVWYPNTMTLISEMDKSGFAPLIVELDFSKLPDQVPVSQKSVSNVGFEKFAEEVYEGFMENNLCR